MSSASARPSAQAWSAAPESGARLVAGPGSCAGTARPRRILPGRRAETGQQPGSNRPLGRNRAGTGQEPGSNRTLGPRPHHSDTLYWKTLAFADISIFLHIFCAEKRLTTQTRTIVPWIVPRPGARNVARPPHPTNRTTSLRALPIVHATANPLEQLPIFLSFFFITTGGCTR